MLLKNAPYNLRVARLQNDQIISRIRFFELSFNLSRANKLALTRVLLNQQKAVIQLRVLHLVGKTHLPRSFFHLNLLLNTMTGYMKNPHILLEDVDDIFLCGDACFKTDLEPGALDQIFYE